jgi:hypothetical protein
MNPKDNALHKQRIKGEKEYRKEGWEYHKKHKTTWYENNKGKVTEKQYINKPHKEWGSN